jgi:alpha/beta superfamily hydrolase
MGGTRSDRRLRTVSDALLDRGVACLRFDYGPWDEGPGERRDAENALDWADERYGHVGLFGYSFGGAVALSVAAEHPDLDAVAALAPAARLPDGIETADALDRLGESGVPTLVVYGERDETVDWRPVVERAQAVGHAVVSLAADHHFVSQDHRVRQAIAPFLVDHLTA